MVIVIKINVDLEGTVIFEGTKYNKIHKHDYIIFRMDEYIMGTWVLEIIKITIRHGRQTKWFDGDGDQRK